MIINPANTVADLSKAFNKESPYLRLEVYKRRQFYMEDDNKLADVTKTLGEISKKLRSTIVSLAPNRKAQTLVDDPEALGIHALITYYVYDWCVDSRAPERRGFVFCPEDDYTCTDTLNQINKEAEKKRHDALLVT